MLETERLILRKYTMDDVEDAYLMNRDPLVQQYIVGEGEPTLDNVRHMICNHVLSDYEKYGYGPLAVIHKSDNRYIGFTGLKFVENLTKSTSASA